MPASAVPALGEPRRRGGRVPVPASLAGPGGQVREPCQVKLRAGLKDVPAARRPDVTGSVPAQDQPELVDVAADHLSRGSGDLIAPQAVDQLFQGDLRALAHQQRRQHRTLPGMPQVQLRLIPPSAHRAKNGEPHITLHRDTPSRDLQELLRRPASGRFRPAGQALRPGAPHGEPAPPAGCPGHGPCRQAGQSPSTRPIMTPHLGRHHPHTDPTSNIYLATQR